MLEGRTYFIVDGEYAIQIEGYYGAITESGRIWCNTDKVTETNDIPRSGRKVYKKIESYFEDILIPRTGYIEVTIENTEKPHKKGRLRRRDAFLLHKLVAQHFIPNPEGYKFVEHIDRIKTNNHYSNLRWVKEDTSFLGYFHNENLDYF
ncbi:HNH endonuclease [Hymenobacter nivis]|uniref:HNH nuclease domain-containing protein n=1 Tax=Hymenobacter nivis TaxID=1850093 RepID=A0A502GUB5_9BACT|nr:HNH endonuclease [Hymenobacter nivis]TPG65464.1 hypothetical protein EAH73_13415 [Hymenobacter nivis]